MKCLGRNLSSFVMIKAHSLKGKKNFNLLKNYRDDKEAG